MARPNREIRVHRYFFEIQARKVKDSIGLITQKDSLNDTDIQAIKILIEVYELLVNPSQGSYLQPLANCNSNCYQVQTEK